MPQERIQLQVEGLLGGGVDSTADSAQAMHIGRESRAEYAQTEDGMANPKHSMRRR